MFIFYKNLLRLYLNGQATLHNLKMGVKRGYITQEEFDAIIKAKDEQDKKDSEILSATGDSPTPAEK